MSDMWTRAQLLASGWTAGRIAAAVTSGELKRRAPGVYTTGADATDWQAYRSTVRAAVMTCDGVVSHESAAALHDIPFLRPQRTHAHFTVARTGGGGPRRGLHIHLRPLRADEVVTVDGIVVTSRARTAVDIATTGDLERAVCAFDAVRRVPRYPEPTDPEPVLLAELSQCLDSLGRRRGSGVARRALELSVDTSDSPGESWSRMQMLSLRLPAPKLQTRHLLDGCVYFSDFDWGSVTGEFDGRGKYGADGTTTTAVLDDERRRHSSFAAAGIEVVRWGWRELTDYGRLRSVLAPALLRGGVLRADDAHSAAGAIRRRGSAAP